MSTRESSQRLRGLAAVRALLLVVDQLSSRTDPQNGDQA
jgi:hypothetical protein